MKHQCTATKKGNEIVFTCPQCPNYERRVNIVTSEMKTKGVSFEIEHEGFSGFITPEIPNKNGEICLN